MRRRLSTAALLAMALVIAAIISAEGHVHAQEPDLIPATPGVSVTSVPPPRDVVPLVRS